MEQSKIIDTLETYHSTWLTTDDFLELSEIEKAQKILVISTLSLLWDPT